MGLKRTTPPHASAVALHEAAQHLIVNHSEDNALIASLVDAATGLVETHTERQLITASWTLTLDCFPRGAQPIELRVCPVQSVTEIRYIDAGGNAQTLDIEDFIVDTASEPARVVPAIGTTWPATQRRINAVEVEFAAGYGEADYNVPAEAKQAILLLAGHWYRAREAVGEVGTEIALAYSSLVWSLKWSL